MKNHVLAALLACAAVAPAHAASVITADRMLDVQTGRYVESPAIFVDDVGRISSIADARTVRWGANVKHVDLSGKTLVPGLIDMHTHLGPADIGGYRFLEFTDSFWPIAAVGTARDMLDAGFTTIRVVGSSKWDDVGLKQAIEAGYAVGPRIIPAGHALGATGGHCDDTFLPPSLQKEKAEGIGDTPDQLKYEVRRQRKFGAEVIKICATGGVFSRNTTPGQQQLSEEELRAIADEAHHGACASRLTPTGRKGSRPRSAPASTRSSMRAWSTTRASGSRCSASSRSGSRWTSRTRTTPRPRARRTACWRRTCARTARSAQIQRDNFRKAHRAGVRMIFGSRCGRDAAQPGRAAVPDDGPVRNDAAGGDPGRNPQRRRGARAATTSGR